MDKGMRRIFLDKQRIWSATFTDPNKPLENKLTSRAKMFGYF